MAINTGKVVAGGVASGVVLAILDFLINGLLLADRNTAAMNALNPALTETMNSPGAMVGYIVVDLLLGIVVAWTYAAMRPRFGAGPGTAVIAAVQIWLIVMLLYIGMTLMGMWAWSYLVIGALAGLVMMIVGALVAGRIYQEA